MTLAAKRLRSVPVVSLLLLSLVACGDDSGESETTSPEDAAAEVEEFYSDNDITLRVGLGEGGGYDQIARLVGRHLGKHLPGNPEVIVENHTGAGSVLNANQMFRQVEADGSVIGINHRQNVLSEVLGAEGIEYSSSEFQWLGGFTETVYSVLVRSELGIESYDQALEEEIIMGGTGPGASTNDTPLMLNGTTGSKFNVVSGYEGAADVALGVERGEVDGQVYGLDGLLGTHKHWVDDKFVNVLLLVTKERDERFPDVPTVYEYIDGEDEEKVVDLYTGPLEMGYPFYAPPETPEAFVEALRQAFADMAEDPEFLTDGESMGLVAEPFHSGEELQETVAGLLDTPQSVKDLFQQLVPESTGGGS